MALWERCQRMQGLLLEQMKRLYGPRFPIEVRHYLANWIEAQSWSEIDPDNPIHEPNARRLFESMLIALQELITTYAGNFITKTQLEALFTHMKSEYLHCPLELIRVVQVCLLTEAELVKKQEELCAPSPGGATTHQDNTMSVQIQQMLQNVVARTEGMEVMYRGLAAKLESFQLHYQEACRLDMVLHQSGVPPDKLGQIRERKKLVEQILAKDSDEMKHTVDDLNHRFLECLDETGRVKHMVVAVELANWKHSQRLFSWEDDMGRVELNGIQRWFETLAELLWRLRQLAKQLEILRSRSTTSILQHADQFASISQHITKFLHELIIKSFVLEKQPPQVIKTSNRFSATIRLLVGSKLQIHLSVPEVTATITNEKQAKAILADPSKQVSNQFSSGEILNNQKAMEYNSQAGILQCNFNYMQLKRIKRNSDKKATETVTEEKFTLLFRSKFIIAGGEMEIPVQCQSLPVVVIVHVTQQPAAEATIFWDNAFSESNREPFVVPELVTWPRLSEALGCYFHAQTGRGLTSQNLDYLGRKLLSVGMEEDISQMSITRQQMCRDQLRLRNFTFWEWFYKHLDLIKSTLKREWMEGLIEGFMDKNEAQQLLTQTQQGTFLVRFSDSEAGGVSVTWMDDNDSGEKQIYRLAPWGKHDFSVLSFADRLHKLNYLTYVYPNRQKDEVFGQYYTPEPATTTSDGYLPAMLTLCVPGGSPMSSRMPSISSNPASPASLCSFTVGTPNPQSPFSMSTGYGGSLAMTPDLGHGFPYDPMGLPMYDGTEQFDGAALQPPM